VRFELPAFEKMYVTPHLDPYMCELSCCKTHTMVHMCTHERGILELYLPRCFTAPVNPP
jgi:hypothetical protein